MPLSGRGRRVGVALLPTLVLVACVARGRAPRPDEMSGFLDDYARLRTGGPEEASLVYRDPDAHWGAYDRLIFEPVTIWRSGKHSLDDVPEVDLQHLAAEFHHAVRVRLEQYFQLVDQPGPRTVRVRLGITQAQQSDRVLDVFTFDVPPTIAFPDEQSLAPATEALIAAAAIEGELTDSVTGTVLAAGVDRRRTRELRSWGDVRAAVDRWATWLGGRIESARRGELR